MKTQLPQDPPINYTIKVQGFVSQRMAESMGLSLQYHDESERVVTTLFGQMVDRAALMGVLNNLYGLGFTLMAVENT